MPTFICNKCGVGYSGRKELVEKFEKEHKHKTLNIIKQVIEQDEDEYKESFIWTGFPYRYKRRI